MTERNVVECDVWNEWHSKFTREHRKAYIPQCLLMFTIWLKSEGSRDRESILCVCVGVWLYVKIVAWARLLRPWSVFCRSLVSVSLSSSLKSEHTLLSFSSRHLKLLVGRSSVWLASKYVNPGQEIHFLLHNYFVYSYNILYSTPIPVVYRIEILKISLLDNFDFESYETTPKYSNWLFAYS